MFVARQEAIQIEDV